MDAVAISMPFDKTTPGVKQTVSPRAPLAAVNRRNPLLEDAPFHVSVRVIVYCCTGLPTLGVVACISLALLLHFEGSTKTHCGVPNFLPSISAAIGDYSPERYVWRICICLHVLPRFMLAWMYKHFYITSPLRPMSELGNVDLVDPYNLMCYLMFILHSLENMALILLTYVSSNENHDFHELAFICFMVFSLIYMMLTIIMFQWSGRTRSSTLGKKSYRYKCFWFGMKLTIFLLSIYFYLRHNSYCEPYVYSMFALCEYLVVMFNIMFHSTVIYDFGDTVLVASTINSGITVQPGWKTS